MFRVNTTRILFLIIQVRSVLQLDRIDAKFRDPIAAKKKESDLFTFTCQVIQFYR